MSKLRSVNTHFWSDTFIIDLDPIEKLVFLYLLTNEQTNMLGIYELHIRRIAFDTGIDKDMLIKIFNRLEEAGKAKYMQGYVILPNFIKHQNFNPKMQISAIRTWNELPVEVRKDTLCIPILKGIKAFDKASEPIAEYEYEYEYELESEKETESETGKPFSKESSFQSGLKKIFQSTQIPKQLDSDKFRRRIFDFNLMWCDRDKRLPAIQTIEAQYMKLLELQKLGDDPAKVIEYAIQGGWRQFYNLPEEKQKSNGQPVTPGQHRSDFLQWLHQNTEKPNSNQLTE